MTDKEAEYFIKILDSIKYTPNIFTITVSEEKVIIGALTPDEPPIQKFFSIATVYNSIVDVNDKIQFSLRESIKLPEELEQKDWNPIKDTNEKEWRSIYYMENAIFRIEILWNLLAQLFNLAKEIGKDNTKIHTKQFFHDCQQGKKASEFAKKIYNYMILEDNCDVEPWEGNYEYVKNYRDKMSHRNSPSLTSFSNYDTAIREPTLYVLKRVVEDYLFVSAYIQELVDEIIPKYKSLEAIFKKGDNNA